jgi:hypothetical protein
MADEADRAEIQEQLARDLSIKAAIGKPLDLSNPSGLCWYCEEPTGTERRFCVGVECRDAWQKENR